jgi:hypothetical protein
MKAMPLLRRASPFKWPLLTILLYWCFKALFFLVTGSVGLFAPSGALNLGVALFGLMLIGLRLLVLFVVPAVIVYRLMKEAWPN